MSENAGHVRSVWLHLLRHGGRWSVQDAAGELNLVSLDLHVTLKQMALTGYVRRWDRSDSQNRITYGVTGDCKVPRGVTVQDIIECDLVPFVAESQC